MNAALQLAVPELRAEDLAARPEAALDAYLWQGFLSTIDEPATAACLVEYLEARPRELARHSGLYLRARITLRRIAIAHAKRIEAARHPLRRLLDHWMREVPDERFGAVATAVCLTTLFWACLSSLAALLG